MKKFYFDKWLDLSKILSIEYDEDYYSGWNCIKVYTEMLDRPVEITSLCTKMFEKYDHHREPANQELREAYNKLLNDWQSL